MKESFGPLYQPLTLPNGVHLANRFVLSPMVTNSSTADGFVTKDDLLYASRRAGSAPLQISGAAYIDPYGQLFEYGFSVAKDADISWLEKISSGNERTRGKSCLTTDSCGSFC